MRRLTAPSLLVALPLLLAACREPEITTYKIPKEKDSAPAATAAAPAPAAAAPSAGASAAPAAADKTMANTAVATASGPGLTWKGPAHWQEKPAGGMRKGTFTLTGDGGATADLAITAFPGDVGGEAANINRWRGQLQLPPQAPGEAVASIQRLEANGLKIGLVEMANPSAAQPTRVLGAFVAHEGATWFFKLTGPDALVAKEKPAFLEFLKTIKAGGK